MDRTTTSKPLIRPSNYWGCLPVQCGCLLPAGHGRLKMGPASLSALMARLLRSQLLAQLEELEPALSKRRAALGR